MTVMCRGHILHLKYENYILIKSHFQFKKATEGNKFKCMCVVLLLINFTSACLSSICLLSTCNLPWNYVDCRSVFNFINGLFLHFIVPIKYWPFFAGILQVTSYPYSYSLTCLSLNPLLNSEFSPLFQNSVFEHTAKDLDWRK